MTLQERVDAFKAAHPQPQYQDAVPYVSPSGRWLYGTWETGNNYRKKTPLYGAYPPRFLDQAMALFPDHSAGRVLHAFSGSLPPGPYVRLDLVPERKPDVVGDVLAPPFTDGFFDLILADTPYSAADAVKYGTPMPYRLWVMNALARVVRVGGHLGWLDTQRPMHRKSDWKVVGLITVQGSTNHRQRGFHIFERQRRST